MMTFIMNKKDGRSGADSGRCLRYSARLIIGLFAMFFVFCGARSANASVSGAANAAVSGTTKAAVSGTVNAAVSGAANAAVSGTANAGGFDNTRSSSSEIVNELLAVKNPSELDAVEAARALVEGLGRAPRLIATSPAVADICDRLELDLVGVCSSAISVIPKRYQDVTVVGTAMSPDMEIVSSLKPDWIFSPVSLQGDLQPKYDAIGSEWAFVNTRSVPGMYRSIQEMGYIFDREGQAQKLVDEFTDFYEVYRRKNEGKQAPKVLILMGLPGSYIIATENSYVGSLVELAGGENVYAGTTKEFLTVNTEDMKTKEPDVILRCAHALPDQVIEMFREDFETNDIWKHFEAVRSGRVYDLTYENFGMSVKFNYPDALDELQPILYPENQADEQKAQENSNKAVKAAEAAGTAS